MPPTGVGAPQARDDGLGATSSPPAVYYHVCLHGDRRYEARTRALFADATAGRITLLLENIEHGALPSSSHSFDGYHPSAEDVASPTVLGLDGPGYYATTARARLLCAVLSGCKNASHHRPAPAGHASSSLMASLTGVTVRDLGPRDGTSAVVAYVQCCLVHHERLRPASALAEAPAIRALLPTLAVRSVEEGGVCPVEILRAMEHRVPQNMAVQRMLADVGWCLSARRWPTEVALMDRLLFTKREARMAEVVCAVRRRSPPTRDVHVLVGLAHLCPEAADLARRLLSKRDFERFWAHQCQLTGPRLLELAPGRLEWPSG